MRSINVFSEAVIRMAGRNIRLGGEQRRNPIGAAHRSTVSSEDWALPLPSYSVDTRKWGNGDGG